MQHVAAVDLQYRLPACSWRYVLIGLFSSYRLSLRFVNRKVPDLKNKITNGLVRGFLTMVHTGIMLVLLCLKTQPKVVVPQKLKNPNVDVK